MAPAKLPTSPALAPAATSGRVDQAQMRAANLALILRHLRTHGGRSRARLAAETGLSKATMSALITELSDRGLVREGAPDRDGSVGRPGLTVSVDGRRVCGLGVEIHVDYLALTAVDLTGTVIRENTIPIAVRSLAVDAVLDRVASAASRMLKSLSEAELTVVSLTLAPPGVIDYERGLLRFAPNLGWRNVPLVAGLAERLGADAPPIHLENDAKLAALAEYSAYAPEGVQDLLFLTGDVGVGAGIIAGGSLIRGWSGFSGEVGHLQLDPEGRPCSCGRTGCWETMVGLDGLFRLVASDGDPGSDPGRPLEDRLEVIQQRAQQGERRTLDALATIAADLALGLSILVDVLNPRVVVLGGYFAYFEDFLIAPVAAALERRRMDEGSGVRLEVSRFGIASVSRGGALVALDAVFDDPTIVPVSGQRD